MRVRAGAEAAVGTHKVAAQEQAHYFGLDIWVISCGYYVRIQRPGSVASKCSAAERCPTWPVNTLWGNGSAVDFKYE
jgi:hypothetical protein